MLTVILDADGIPSGAQRSVFGISGGCGMIKYYPSKRIPPVNEKRGIGFWKSKEYWSNTVLERQNTQRISSCSEWAIST